MAGRTNKMGILKQKRQAEKQKKLAGGSASKISLEGQKKDYENPKGNVYTWFFRSGKLICENTTCREDPDGYRPFRKPNSGEIHFVYKGEESWGFRRYIRKQRRMSYK
ncbi:hypothetical protein [Candidatus Absconditicoccus praedator]|uniref:hypothetical protein n=1 Tax=Candidatus Absconditicoccus praedator TaxID=2735562 RepID=UPI001E4AC917|nr:hypothetical protein [Candidatus Absconditicoccus praedator]UFX82812.1 hypothetical protein HLG78_01540 [Candidatus Absconditicoccus praedator]